MPRIRTVKPEFWSHPVLSTQPDEARLLAIALLNLSDDEGYFFASASLVRSFAWPFDEDSTRTRRALATLSDVGWISVKTNPIHGDIGVVVNFTKHQKIDRPSVSKIKAYWFDERSTSARRTLDEASSLYQGSGIRDQGSGNEGERTCNQTPFDSPSNKHDPPSRESPDRWRYEQSEPWASGLKAAGCKIGPNNWPTWKALAEKHGNELVRQAAAGVDPEERWSDAVEKAIAARGEQAGSIGERVKSKIVRITT